MRRTVMSIVALGAIVAGCGSSSSKAAVVTTTATTAAATTTATTASTAASATTAAASPTTASATTAAAATGDAGIKVGEKEFAIDLGGALKAGANTLSISNTGSFPHELKIVKADSYAALPKAADGSVDEAALGAAVVAKSAKVAAGASGTLTATLDAGKYVVVCNLGAGANNHAAKGMHVDVTVG